MEFSLILDVRLEKGIISVPAGHMLAEDTI
jgi:hypothetical protein